MKPFSLLLLSLAIVACAPPYSAELNSAAPLADQMTLLGTLGPVKSPDGSSTTAIKFLPIKPAVTTTSLGALNVETGFLVSQSPGHESLCFAYQESGGNVRISDFRQGFSLVGADPHYPLYEYDVLASTATTANILVFYLGDPTTPGDNTFQYLTATLPNGPFQSTLGPTFMDAIFGSTFVIAAQVFPQPAAADTFNFLVFNGTIYQEGTTTFSGSGFALTTPGSTVPLSGAGSRVLYYLATGVSSASYYTGGKWVCYQWTPPTISSPTLLTGVTHRIDAVLTNGDLLSTEEGTLRIYDSSGSEKLSVGMGALQFCYEAYIGTTPYVFFSLSLPFRNENWAFRVYAIKTKDLLKVTG